MTRYIRTIHDKSLKDKVNLIIRKIEDLEDRISKLEIKVYL